MNFFKNLIGTSLPYDNEEKLAVVQERSFHYSMYTARKVSEKKQISLFEYPPHNPKVLTDNVLRRFRTLKHPNILSYIDHIMNDKNMIVMTEEVYPLSSFINSNKCTEDMILWGLFSIANAIQFLNINAHLGHFNITENSIYVTKSGEWKLGGLQYVSDLTNPGELESCIEANRSSDHLPNDLRSEFVDSYGFSKLAKSLYKGNSQPLLALINNLPTQTITSFLTHPALSTPFLTIVYNIDNYSALDEHTRKSFLKSITKQQLPILFCKYKLLPFYIDLFRSNMPEAPNAVESMLKVAGGLEQDEFITQVQDYIPKFLSSSDLLTKYTTLGSLRFCCHHFTEKFADSLFATVMQSAQNQNEKIRDAGIRALLCIVDKLPQKKQIEVAQRYEKTIADPSLIVRTNAIVCISKCCKYFPVESRKKMLMMSIARSGQDTVKEMRNAVMFGITEHLEEFTPVDIARNILPYVAIFLIDDAKEVRIKSKELYEKINAIVFKYSDELNAKQKDDDIKPNDQTMNELNEMNQNEIKEKQKEREVNRQKQLKQQQMKQEQELNGMNLKRPGDVVYDQQKHSKKLNLDMWNVDEDDEISLNKQSKQSKEDLFGMFESDEPTHKTASPSLTIGKTSKQPPKQSSSTMKTATPKTNNSTPSLTKQKSPGINLNTKKSEDDDIERMTSMMTKKQPTADSKTFQKSNQKQKQLKEVDLPQNLQRKTPAKKGLVLENEKKEEPKKVQPKPKIEKKDSAWGDDEWEDWAGSFSSSKSSKNGDLFF